MTTMDTCQPTAFGKLLGHAARLWRRVADQRLQPHGLTEATWLPLLHIANASAPLKQKELAAALSLDGSSVVRLIDSLEQGGLVIRCEEGKDRRVKEIRLTRNGAAMVDSLEVLARGLTEDALAGLPPEDVEATRRVLDHVCRYFSAELGEQPQEAMTAPAPKFARSEVSAVHRTQ